MLQVMGPIDHMRHENAAARDTIAAVLVQYFEPIEQRSLARLSDLNLVALEFGWLSQCQSQVALLAFNNINRQGFWSIDSGREAASFVAAGIVQNPPSHTEEASLDSGVSFSCLMGAGEEIDTNECAAVLLLTYGRSDAIRHA